MGNILTPHMAQAAQEAEPHEILVAIHGRIVETEKLMVAYRTHAQNLETTIAMLQERIEKLEKYQREESELFTDAHDKYGLTNE
jgi:hypothetical protein